MYCKNPNLLSQVGKDGGIEKVEEFVCQLYNAVDATTVNIARCKMFDKGKVALEMLPLTYDALELHLSRANYQAKIWLQADKQTIMVDSPGSVAGWQMNQDGLAIVWNRLPGIPTKCVELVTCDCKSKYKTAGCRCYQNDQPCMSDCGCAAEGLL